MGWFTVPPNDWLVGRFFLWMKKRWHSLTSSNRVWSVWTFDMFDASTVIKCYKSTSINDGFFIPHMARFFLHHFMCHRSHAPWRLASALASWPSPEVWPPIEPLEIRRPVMSVGSQVHGREAQVRTWGRNERDETRDPKKKGWNQDIFPEK